MNYGNGQYCNNLYNTDKISFMYFRRLQNNQITVIQPGAFKDLPRLAWMYVYNKNKTKLYSHLFAVCDLSIIIKYI